MRLIAALLCLWPALCAAQVAADRIVILKSERILELVQGATIVESFPIALGQHPIGPKRQKGDGKTPEGWYVIDGRLRDSKYHRALHISYPGPKDLKRARAGGYDPGDAIYIHGMPEEFGRTDPTRFYVDWTDGCISVGNRAIEKLWAVVPVGTIVEIRP